MTASNIVLIVQAEFHYSVWYCVIVRHILVLTSKRPFLFAKIISGGLKGYSKGNKIWPWYKP
jgi:hypothetical protein